MDSTLIAILVISLVTVSFGGYVYLMLFHPEWVGITGRSARKTQDEHVEGSKADDSDFFDGQKK